MIRDVVMVTNVSMQCYILCLSAAEHQVGHSQQNLVSIEKLLTFKIRVALVYKYHFACGPFCEKEPQLLTRALAAQPSRAANRTMLPSS